MRLSSITFAMAMLVSGFGVDANATPALNGAAALEHVEFDIALLDEAPVLPRLPILIEVRIKNVGARSIEVPHPVFSERYHDNYTVALDYRAVPDATGWREIGSVVPSPHVCHENAHSPAPEIMRLDPGRTLVAKVPVSYDWDIRLPRLIVKEGQLTLRARLMAVEAGPDGKPQLNPESFIESNVLKIDVPAPTGEAAAALAAIEKRREPWLIASPRMLESTIDEWGFMPFVQQIVANYPDTTYALYARASLAHLYAAGELEISKSNARPPDWPAAIRTIRQVRGDPRYVLVADADDLIERYEILRRGRAEAIRNGQWRGPKSNGASSE